MDLERTMTIIAGAAVAFILLGYAFTPARDIALSAAAAEGGVVSADAGFADDAQSFNAIADLAALAAYQATLPVTWYDHAGTAQKLSFLQIADRAELAAYQATLTTQWVGEATSDPTRSSLAGLDSAID
jgi:hypothetical protein